MSLFYSIVNDSDQNRWERLNLQFRDMVSKIEEDKLTKLDNLLYVIDSLLMEYDDNKFLRFCKILTVLTSEEITRLHQWCLTNLDECGKLKVCLGDIHTKMINL